MPIDLLGQTTQDFASWTTDEARPDYACPAYREMAPRWQLVHDIGGDTIAIRYKKAIYLPKFEAESPEDWNTRVAQTFTSDQYADTLEEHVGLVFAQDLKLGDDVPDEIKDLCEDIDGEGNHIDVFAQSALESALHFGHCVLWTDYPVPDGVKTLADARRSNLRPYVTLYRACDVLSWHTEVVGGVRTPVKIMLRETSEEASGEFGVREVVRYREVKQAVTYDQITGRATALGAITWRAWEQRVEGESRTEATFVPAGEGAIVGPVRIPARIVYGGKKLGFLKSKPHLLGLAYSNAEETQVQSDYANVMHKCNVPTPVFIGRNQDQIDKGVIVMGRGVDIPEGGDAKFLEPTGVALAATRTRLTDIQSRMRKQGATPDDEQSKTMTKGEADLYAKQRNAKLLRAARSLQDALEGVLADMAAFRSLPSGGSVVVNKEFAGQSLDPAYLQVLVQAYGQGAFPLEALLYALQHGQLPDDFSAEEEALRLIASHVDVPDPTGGIGDTADPADPLMKEAA